MIETHIVPLQIDCCTVYSVEELRPFMNTLTQLILKEVMLSPDKKTEDLALKALGHVAKCLAKPVCGLSSSCASMFFTFVVFPNTWET